MIKNTYYTKREAASYLCSLGLPVAEKSLSKYITTGNGPNYQKFGRRVVYTKDNLEKWANGRLSKTYNSSCEIGE